MERTIAITGDMIRLGQLLKLAGMTVAGGDAKALIVGRLVSVNGEVEVRRGRQLHPGDLVRVGPDVLRIVSG